MEALATKRIIKDLKDLEKNSLKEFGIYHLLNEDNIFNIKALIIGPKDTPYENGFFFFDILITNEYPFKPPVVKFCTQDSNIRYNPNLYVNGKVCLSILNTWEGPKWSSTQSISSILLTLQSILNDYPLQNEPGFEDDKSIKSTNYNEVIQHETLRFSVFELLKNPPRSFETFLPIMEDYFIDNFDNYVALLQNNEKKYREKNFFLSQVYALNCQNKYKELLKESVVRYSDLKKKYKLDVTNILDKEESKQFQNNSL